MLLARLASLCQISNIFLTFAANVAWYLIKLETSWMDCQVLILVKICKLMFELNILTDQTFFFPPYTLLLNNYLLFIYNLKTVQGVECVNTNLHKMFLMFFGINVPSIISHFWEVSGWASILFCWLKIIRSLVWILQDGDFISWLYVASLYRAFSYHAFNILIWLK